LIGGFKDALFCFSCRLPSFRLGCSEGIQKAYKLFCSILANSLGLADKGRNRSEKSATILLFLRASRVGGATPRHPANAQHDGAGVSALERAGLRRERGIREAMVRAPPVP